jgi:hypothetical protein
MTARITRDFNFVAGVYFDNELYMNMYEATIQFLVKSENISEQNIAMERVKYFIYSLEHHIFVFEQNKEAIEKLSNANIKMCVLPEEPYDQIIGIMLLVKANAITEGRLVPDDIVLSSRMSDGVSCLHSNDENVGPFKFKGWWNDVTPNIHNVIGKSKKVVTLKKIPNNWDDLFLGWTNKKDDNLSTEIVFARFESKTEK